PHKNLKAAPLQPGDEVGAFTYAQFLRMDSRYVAAAEEAIRLGLERRTSAFAEQRTGTSNRAGGMETGIYGATLQWARVGVIMVVCSWHNALGAAQLPREIVGNWCLAIERMLIRCKDFCRTNGELADANLPNCTSRTGSPRQVRSEVPNVLVRRRRNSTPASELEEPVAGKPGCNSL